MAGMLNNMANLANAKLTADLTSSATTVTLDDASPFANLGTFYATIMPAGEMSRLSNSEIVKCDYASSTTLAITRAQRGTSARAFTSGAILTNGIYVEDLEQAQYVGDGVFDTSYSAGVYTITTNKNMLPAIPSDGMKINVRINTDSSGTPGLDLQGTGAIYSIYSGALVNNELGAHGDSGGAALLAGETYELVFDAEVGGGCWKATGLVQLADVPFYDTLSTGSGQLDVPFYEQVGGGSSHPIGTDDIEDGAVTSSKIEDSGWIDISSQVGLHRCAYRKKGGIVYLTVESAGDVSIGANYKTICTLPVGYRPTVAWNFVWQNISSADSRANGWVNSDGTVQLYSSVAKTYWYGSTSFPAG